MSLPVLITIILNSVAIVVAACWIVAILRSPTEDEEVDETDDEEEAPVEISRKYKALVKHSRPLNKDAFITAAETQTYGPVILVATDSYNARVTCEIDAEVIDHVALWQSHQGADLSNMKEGKDREHLVKMGELKSPQGSGYKLDKVVLAEPKSFLLYKKPITRKRKIVAAESRTAVMASIVAEVPLLADESAFGGKAAERGFIDHENFNWLSEVEKSFNSE